MSSISRKSTRASSDSKDDDIHRAEQGLKGDCQYKRGACPQVTRSHFEPDAGCSLVLNMFFCLDS